jgi:hypothetical protein
MLGFVKPMQWYNVAMHEYAKVFQLKYPEEAWPAFAEEDVWTKLESVSGMPRAHVESVIGLAGVEAFPVAVHHYFTFPLRFAAVFPTENQAFEKIFGFRA